MVKARDNNMVINKAVYLAIGINMEGKKELLGIWGLARMREQSFGCRL